MLFATYLGLRNLTTLFVSILSKRRIKRSQARNIKCRNKGLWKIMWPGGLTSKGRPAGCPQRRVGNELEQRAEARQCRPQIIQKVLLSSQFITQGTLFYGNSILHGGWVVKPFFKILYTENVFPSIL